MPKGLSALEEFSEKILITINADKGEKGTVDCLGIGAVL